jgi:hypothetical protein
LSKRTYSASLSATFTVKATVLLNWPMRFTAPNCRKECSAILNLKELFNIAITILTDLQSDFAPTLTRFAVLLTRFSGFRKDTIAKFGALSGTRARAQTKMCLTGNAMNSSVSGSCLSQMIQICFDYSQNEILDLLDPSLCC